MDMIATDNIPQPVDSTEEARLAWRRGWRATIIAICIFTPMVALGVLEPGTTQGFGVAGLPVAGGGLVVMFWPFFAALIVCNSVVAMLHGAIKRGSLLLLGAPAVLYGICYTAAVVARYWVNTGN